MHRVLYTILFCSVFFSSVKAMDCYDGRYKKKVFTQFIRLNNIGYATKQRSDGRWQKLWYDVYLPKNDTVTNRPAVVLAHGGGYIDLLDQKSPDIVELAMDLVLRGYVVFSIEYREEASPLSLLVEQNMVKAVGRSLIDIRDATCSIMDTTLNYGNPFGVDYTKVVVGGVSAGAVSFLHALFLDSLSWMPPQYQQWILQVEPNSQALLDNRYCGANVLGMIGISGAILDTAWILPNRSYPALLLQHGTSDPIVPYNYDHPFHIPFLPKLYGSFPINKRYADLGLRCEFQSWLGYHHVPFIGGINIEALFNGNPLAIIFNPSILDSTKRHVANFCYSLIGCDERVTSIRQNIVSTGLNVFPNPSSGTFYINLPNDVRAQQWNVQIFDVVGKEYFRSTYNNNTEQITVDIDLPTGLYIVKLYYEKNNEQFAYTGKLSVTK